VIRLRFPRTSLASAGGTSEIAHPVRYPGHVGRLRRGIGDLGRRHAPRRARPRSLLHHGDGSPLRAEQAEDRRPRDLHRPPVPDLPLAEGKGRLQRQAGRRRRHRILCRAVDPRDREGGEAPHRIPAHGSLRDTRAQRPGRSRARATGQGELPRAPRAREAILRRLHQPRIHRPHRADEVGDGGERGGAP
jgi:hypothetical protein